MTVQQVVDLAQEGDLKNTSVATNVGTILGYLNLGLIELYKRFVVDTEEVIITLGEDGTTLDPYEIIDDTIYKMPSDFMYLVAAYGEVSETSGADVSILPINEEDNPLSVNTISWNKVQIPLIVTGSYVSLIYVSSPEYFTSDDLEKSLPIPVQMVEPLLLYMTYKGYASIGSSAQEDDAVAYGRFEASCNKIKELGVFTSDDVSMVKRIDTRGFV